jgi:hypothetical protein
MLLVAIEAHMRRTKMTSSRFGREALGDPALVENLRAGRKPRPRTIARILRYIAEQKRANGRAAVTPTNPTE